MQPFALEASPRSVQDLGTPGVSLFVGDNWHPPK
jgi:hypothetical protein